MGRRMALAGKVLARRSRQAPVKTPQLPAAVVPKGEQCTHLAAGMRCRLAHDRKNSCQVQQAGFCRPELNAVICQSPEGACLASPDEAGAAWHVTDA